jgi:hypothetical protein
VFVFAEDDVCVFDGPAIDAAAAELATVVRIRRDVEADEDA